MSQKPVGNRKSAGSQPMHVLFAESPGLNDKPHKRNFSMPISESPTSQQSENVPEQTQPPASALNKQLGYADLAVKVASMKSGKTPTFQIQKKTENNRSNLNRSQIGAEQRQQIEQLEIPTRKSPTKPERINKQVDITQGVFQDQFLSIQKQIQETEVSVLKEKKNLGRQRTSSMRLMQEKSRAQIEEKEEVIEDLQDKINAHVTHINVLMGQLAQLRHLLSLQTSENEQLKTLIDKLENELKESRSKEEELLNGKHNAEEQLAIIEQSKLDENLRREMENNEDEELDKQKHQEIETMKQAMMDLIGQAEKERNQWETEKQKQKLIINEQRDKIELLEGIRKNSEIKQTNLENQKEDLERMLYNLNQQLDQTNDKLKSERERAQKAEDENMKKEQQIQDQDKQREMIEEIIIQMKQEEEEERLQREKKEKEEAVQRQQKEKEKTESEQSAIQIEKIKLEKDKLIEDIVRLKNEKEKF
ncbi:MAG: hypothetical protein EZS28_006880 [Streblomastix strix]|uniref:Uncharacterized protein n=1 Tax=Streblomastix strix TaxID=222440 RepID=A0A5J4WRN2_9EUKA|nr:MAG: hypothetical protein EZS28_006880 [Streblomastix strix]